MKVLRLALLCGLSLVAVQVGAQNPRRAGGQSSRPGNDTTFKLEIYGFGQADMIQDLRENDPAWFDVNRPSKLPAFHDEFGQSNHNWFSARQSRFGVKGNLPTDRGDIKTQFEFDMFGVGVDAGQTTIRLRYAYGQWGPIGAGQLPSPFMDLDVFPNILEYWGPNGMIFFRNVQIFYQPINNEKQRFTIALERPGASADEGRFADRIELQDVFGRFPIPDVSAQYRYSRKWGHVQLAGIVRTIRWDDVLTDTFDLSGGTTGWGLNLSSNLKPTKRDVIRLQAIYGKGVENYFNDAPVDVGIVTNFGVRRRPIIGRALNDLGLVAYLDHNWKPEVSSAIGWSMVKIDNTDGQLASAFHYGQYASFNALYNPVPQVLMGAEFQWGYRRNFNDGWRTDDYRIQVSLKYSFSKKFGGSQ